MKYSLPLGLALIASWLLWSGHFEPFMLLLGLVSCLLSVWICRRMRIVDSEGAPVQLGIRPFTNYAPWLAWEIVKSNIEVTKIILSRKMKLQRNLVEVGANPKSELGLVILANSITLTPGTVSVSVDDDKILVHALSLADAEEDLSGDMERRVRQLEGEVDD
jgi:multicomponent Na+:H+ antiporter subunit E